MDRQHKFLFDAGDYELARFLHPLIEKQKSKKYLKRLFDPYLHPHGIKELAAIRETRIAYAMINLLSSLDAGKVQDRLDALQALHAEIMSGAKSSFRINTARVLLQIMKDIVRFHGDSPRQLERIHDFRVALTGKPRIIRAELRRNHLLEMAEEWNQIAFDDHVHDANTKGRKTPTHLIMDAWIKGVRSLKVIYYNHIQPEAARELLEAADIMGIRVRVSVEFPVKWQNGYVQLIWAPRGFSSADDFLNFLKREPVQELMRDGMELSRYQQAHTLAVLDFFNRTQVPRLNEQYQIELAPISVEELTAFAGAGLPSLVHLAELIYDKVAEKGGIGSENFSPDWVFQTYLSNAACPEIVYPGGFTGGEVLPRLLTLSMSELLARFSLISSGYRLTLNLSGLDVEDVLGLLFAAGGKITHLEIFNLKDFCADSVPDHSKIEQLRQIINDQNVIRLKRFILQISETISASGADNREERVEQLNSYLDRLPELLNGYRKMPLRTQIGSDSTGRFWMRFGMGFVALDTLPQRAQREVRKEVGQKRIRIPFRLPVFPRKTYRPRTGHGPIPDHYFSLLRRLPFLGVLGYTAELEWIEEDTPSGTASFSDIVSLGGGVRKTGPETNFSHTASSLRDFWHSTKYLHSGLHNLLKVLIGFIPAFLTFYLTKNDWWVLQYGGAVIWFSITGFRNVLQAVLGGRGFHKYDLLSWKDFVSWSRVADSLLFTGFSVPLLDYFVKTLLLSRGLGITTSTSPVMLYTVMAIANGIYISTHNLFRGLPRGAVIGNLFRSILSIPVAILFNGILGGILTAYGVPGANVILQKWAAVISKLASDCVAGVIEGVADRLVNIRIRMEDYRLKIRQILETFARLELLYPREHISQLLESPKLLLREDSPAVLEIKQIMVINALDMLYFWMYQPRARDAFRTLFQSMTPDEQRIVLISQNILKCEKEISRTLIDGLIGKRFAAPLAFYLDSQKKYLKAIREQAGE